MKNKKISIIMLTHNAPFYVKKAVESIFAHSKDVNYELIVVDNGSHLFTRLLLRNFKNQGKINKLKLNHKNLFFSKGNNLGCSLASDDSTHFLLINSDVEIKSDRWLSALLSKAPEGGICAYGLVRNTPMRADGYCILFDRKLFEKFKLDEAYEWFWSITKIEAQALKSGKRVVAIEEHEQMLHHFGGKSGTAFRHAAGMSEDHKTICSWFDGHEIEVIRQIVEE